MKGNRLLELSGLFNMRWNCSLEEEVMDCTKKLYSGVEMWRHVKKRRRERTHGIVV